MRWPFLAPGQSPRYILCYDDVDRILTGPSNVRNKENFTSFTIDPFINLPCNPSKLLFSKPSISYDLKTNSNFFIAVVMLNFELLDRRFLLSRNKDFVL